MKRLNELDGAGRRRCFNLLKRIVASPEGVTVSHLCDFRDGVRLMRAGFCLGTWNSVRTLFTFLRPVGKAELKGSDELIPMTGPIGGYPGENKRKAAGFNRRKVL
jgi:hypothetical protein